MSGGAPVSLLVKARTIAPAAAMALAGQPLAVTVKPLMPSIDAARAAGLGAAAPPRWHHVQLTGWQGSAWDACHEFAKGSGLGAVGVEFVEPDLEQQWTFEERRTANEALAAAACTAADAQRSDYPHLTDNDWFRDPAHGEFLKAVAALPGSLPIVRVAHLDTGYDPNHHALPETLLTNLAKNFVDDPPTADASDQATGTCNNKGHGTGTLSLLAGRDPADRNKTIGAAPFVQAVPIRVANRVVLFSNSAIAKALDYVHSLCDRDETRIHVVTMSMGGVGSQAWADAVNALYDRGVFVVTAAGNNYGNLPTRFIVYPARFNRVVAACGAMANGAPYADLAPKLMAGNYGPTRKMATAVTAYTPNTPWARLGCADIVDHDGGGTSAATPQVAAAAAIWIAKNAAAWSAYPKDWMRVEAIRAALFQSADKQDAAHFGNGLLKSAAAMAIVPKASDLKAQEPDAADFAILRVLTGVGLAAAPDARQRMLELEALQLAQTGGIEHLVSDQDGQPSKDAAVRIARALVADPRASTALRRALAPIVAQGPAAPAIPPAPPKPSSTVAKAVVTTSNAAAQTAAAMQSIAAAPPLDPPKRRMLRVYAYDPSLGSSLETVGINEAILDVRWEDLKVMHPGPVGEYLEVIDVDPASKAAYAPVDLNDPYLLHEQGLSPSETDPRFHQQMVYAVASRTIEYFERALGRVALWAPQLQRSPGQVTEAYVQRLRIYPHAMRAENAYYSPDKKALLLGYFNASETDPTENAPGSLVFCALSHDIVAHETTHALLDGLHRRYIEATNPDVLAFHEGFADLVALFQHFTLPEALKAQIAKTRGDLRRQNLLGQLAVQFGHATGSYGALRDAIGHVDEQGVWHPAEPHTSDYDSMSEPHARGAVLVAAVFDAFLQLYRTRTADLIRLATGGTGILGDGALPADLTERLAQEAATIAGHCLEICIRALDYCPPVDITFGDYLRALITADRDIAPEDPLGYRVAFVAGFRARGILPTGVRSLSAESLAWEPPPQPLANLPELLAPSSQRADNQRLWLDWDLRSHREHAYRSSKHNAAIFQRWLVSDAVSEAELTMLGLVRHGGSLSLGDAAGMLGPIEVHSVRPARRVGPDRQTRAELIVEITQTWRKTKANQDDPDMVVRGGCTLVVSLETSKALYLVRKRVDHQGRYARQAAFQAAASLNSLRANYFDDQGSHNEPFAALHQVR